MGVGKIMVYIIEKMKDGDWRSVSQIYKEGIETSLATFEEVEILLYQ